MVVHAGNTVSHSYLLTRKARDSKAQSHPQLHTDFDASLGDMRVLLIITFKMQAGNKQIDLRHQGMCCLTERAL